MPDRHLPVRPDLDQLKHQAKELLRALHASDLGAIVAFRIRIRRLTAKFKLSQNRVALDRTRVAAALDAGDAESTAVAAWMRQYAGAAARE